MDVLTPDFKDTPYWWEAVPRPTLPETPLPKSVDVAIVGSGYTGLSAALTLARAGRSVLLFEAEDAGHGASTRNSGFIGSALRSTLTSVIEHFGTERASAMGKEAVAAHRYLVSLIQREQISCHFVYCGRLMPAHSPAAYEALARELDLLKKHAGLDGTMVPRAELHREVGSDIYFGGSLLPLNGSLHPALYHAGLLDRVRSSGAAIHARTPVTSVTRESDGRFTVATPRGTVSARDVILATNGYTARSMPWVRNRMIPVHAGVMVSEPIAPERLRKALPTLRTMIDTKRNPYSSRPSPDGTRIQFAAARGLLVRDHRAKAREMHAAFSHVFPDLADVRVAYCWTGQMGYTFDSLPHIGMIDGMHYAMGYCGTGVPMSTWLGHKLALRVMGDPEGATAFDGREFPSRVYYRGWPWFLPIIVNWYRFQDNREMASARRRARASH
ncbi:MAG: FAD-binding oxidoreductase [Alphaproteobacteria bacterium]